MLVQAVDPPERGTYLELRRGAHAIIARVAWTAGNRFGAYTQDPLNVDALVSDSAEPEAASGQPGDTDAIERRSALRAQGHNERHERNRWAARAFELACLAGFGFGLAMLAGQTLRQALAAPLSVTSAALEQR